MAGLAPPRLGTVCHAQEVKMDQFTLPESFKVLINELQSLCLDVKVYSEEREEIDIG